MEFLLFFYISFAWNYKEKRRFWEKEAPLARGFLIEDGGSGGYGAGKEDQISCGFASPA